MQSTPIALNLYLTLDLTLTLTLTSTRALTRTLTQKEQRNSEVSKVSMQEKLDLYETRLEQKAKHHERLKGFYKRELDQKEKYAIELRDELNEAKCKLNVIQHGKK
jgi:hypothetical protein